MVDGGQNLEEVLAKEINDVIGLVVPTSDLFDMTDCALKIAQNNRQKNKQKDTKHDFVAAAESLAQAMYPSPGASDESNALYLCQQRLDRGDIDKLRHKVTGFEKEGEKIKLKLVRLTELWWESARDSKVLAALSLYENLKREGELPSMPDDIGREVKKEGSGEMIQKAAEVSTL